ncbi:MAG TPA: phosphotransferase, partial [Acidimicrobiales bacterium]|nr:phosphotransferase [Acidimicrobiales bacterium]
MHEDEVAIDDRLVGQLVSDQFPAFSGLGLSRLASTGTDLVVYRLGDDLAVRLPRVAWAAAQVEKERRWLGHLAPGLPAALPEVVAVGGPGRGYPFSFLVSRWLAG